MRISERVVWRSCFNANWSIVRKTEDVLLVLVCSGLRLSLATTNDVCHLFEQTDSPMFTKYEFPLKSKREDRCPVCGEYIHDEGVKRYGKRFCRTWHADFYRTPPPWWRRLRWPEDDGYTGGGGCCS